jgi:ribonuclease T1
VRLRALKLIVVSVLVGVVAAIAPDLSSAKSSPAYQTESFSVVTLADLPKQGRETYALILKGGPFPYPKDGVTFGNRERILPKAPRGYYREYTVKTPYSRTRGAKRIICGAGREQATPDDCFYTDDHYASFRRIAP